ncbi:MAG: Unknown protein [uncultured Aureispira sp.]|uniref:Sulfotransferase domain-containing protein n=1 Tax=uncultured Aureispira sp. TaxID=1331704 RepID=A0A6S6UAD2_9BACT|nr:MAG: Unknown protein [uncultured Aureispira sp.]
MFKKIATKIGNQRHYYQHLTPSKLDAVFVVSTGRTGTKFFETFFNNVDQHTFAVHEPQPDFFDLSMEKYRGKKSTKSVAESIFQKRDPYLRNFCAQRIKRYVECNPFLSLLLPETKATFKKAKFIVLTRQPETYIKSALNKSPLDDGAFYFYGEKDKRIRLKAADIEGDPYQKDWETFSRMQKIAWYWSKCNEILLDFLEENQSICLHIHFEDLFTKENARKLETIHQMLSFLDIQLTEKKVQDLLALTHVKKNQTQKLIFEGIEGWSDEKREQFYTLTKTVKNRISLLR